MRRYRKLVRPLLVLPASAVFVSSAFAGIAHADGLAVTGNTPAGGALITSPGNVPTQTQINFNQPVSAPGSGSSSVTVTRNGAPFAGTAGGGVGSLNAQSLRFTPTSGFANGIYAVTAHGVSAIPGQGSADDNYTFTVDAFQAALQSASPADGASAKAAGLVVSGTYDAPLNMSSSTIAVKNHAGATIAPSSSTPTFSSDGRTIGWSAAAPLTMDGGPYAVSVEAVDVAGHFTSSAWSFNVDNPPTISHLSNAAVANLKAVPVNGSVAEPNGTVALTVRDGSGHKVTKTVSITSSSWSTTIDLTTLTDGAISASATQTDAGGVTSSASRVVSATKDTVVPAAHMLTPTNAFTVAQSLTSSWVGSDTGSGLSSYDVRYRTAPMSGGFGSYVYPAGWQHTTTTTGFLFGATPGYDYCFSVRSRDKVGNVSPWSAPLCTAVLADDRALSTTTGTWTLLTGSSYYDNTYTQSATASSALTLPTVQADRFELMATRCSTCGSVGIYVGGTLLKTVNLSSSVTQYKWTYSFTTSYVTGALSIKVLSPTGKTVQIDAFGASRS